MSDIRVEVQEIVERLDKSVKKGDERKGVIDGKEVIGALVDALDYVSGGNFQNTSGRSIEIKDSPLGDKAFVIPTNVGENDEQLNGVSIVFVKGSDPTARISANYTKKPDNTSHVKDAIINTPDKSEKGLEQSIIAVAQIAVKVISEIE